MKRIIKCFCFVLVAVTLDVQLIGCKQSSHDEHDHGGHHHEDSENDYERGIHGGRLLTKGAFSLELELFESGVAPQYRVYAYEDGMPIVPDKFSAEVILRRLAGRVDRFEFYPVGDFLASNKLVEEPHSFDVDVKAVFNGKEYTWSFESVEGRTTISDEVAKLSGLKTERATNQTIKKLSRVRGRIVPSEHRLAHVIPRFSGIVREGRKHIGDKVDKGEVVAVIESNQNLRPFEVRSQIAGTVINGHLVVGEFVPENEWIYVVADLSEVWADFYVPLGDELEVRVGQKLVLAPISGQPMVEAEVSYVAPYVDEKSQSQLVRLVVPNQDSKFLPGMFVLGDITVSEHVAEVAVKESAVQSFRDWQVVFARYKDMYEVRPLELGHSDGEWVEVLSGLAAGDEYVTENAFLIKADILKSGAHHDH